MSRPVLLVEIGASGLPAVTPVETVPAPWVAHVYTAPPTPPPGSVTTTPAADSVTLNWDAVPGADEYLIEVAPAAAGPWKEVARVRGTRYTYTTTGTAPLYFRVRAVINGVPGIGGNATGTPVPVPTEAELIAIQQQQDQDRADSVQRDLQTAIDAATDATAKANAARYQALARVDALAAEVGEIVNAPEWSVTETYIAGWLVREGGNLYRARVENTGRLPSTSPSSWEYIGQYASAAEAAAAALQLATANASDIAAEAVRISSMQARMPAGADKLANEARVVAAETAAANANSATANRVGVVEARMPSGTGTLGTAADVAAAATAAQAASDLAGSKGKVIYGSSAPAAADRKPENLWIDTTGGANTPKRWTTGTTWVAVTDKAATDAAAAAAAALSHSQGVDARVTTVESASVSRDNALSSRTSVVEARMPAGNGELATAGALSATQAQVDSQGTAIGTLTGQVTAANNTANQAVTATEQLKATVGGGGNLLPGSTLAEINDVVYVYYSSVGSFTIVQNNAGADWHPPGINNFGWAHPGSPSNSDISAARSRLHLVPVTPGEKYIVSVYAAGHRCRGGFTPIFCDSAGNEVAYGARVLPPSLPGGGTSLVDWARLYTSVTIPAGVAYIVIQFEQHFIDGQADPYIWFCRPMIEQAAANQTEPSPWSAGGQELAASHTVALDVNGYISGTQSMNDGTRSSFSVLADVFRVIAPAGAQGMEWLDGYLRVYGPSWQRLIGHNFGVAGDRLVDWFGPNVGAAAASRANGLQWSAVREDGVPVAYFGGEVLQGVLRSFKSSTTVSNTASISTGAISRKGKEIAVTGRFQYQYMQSYPAFASQITLAGGSTVATIVLERRYGTGAWTELSRATIAGSDYVLNESDGPSSITQSISGQIFATDVASTANTEYRTRVLSIAVRQHTVTNPGNVPAAVQSQYQSIESLE